MQGWRREASLTLHRHDSIKIISHIEFYHSFSKLREAPRPFVWPLTLLAAFQRGFLSIGQDLQSIFSPKSAWHSGERVGIPIGRRGVESCCRIFLFCIFWCSTCIFHKGPYINDVRRVRGRGSKIPKISLASFMYGPRPQVLFQTTQQIATTVAFYSWVGSGSKFYRIMEFALP